jgi:rRNA maturation RNase YbeY
LAPAVIGSLFLTNAQSSQRIRLGILRQVARALVHDLLNRAAFELGIILVSDREITRLNETFLRHQGPTDVIAFDYALYPAGDVLRGEIFLCVHEAQRQARRFRTSWQQELVRYLVHGMLHLCGYRDDSSPARSKMKQIEDRCLRRLSRRFPLNALAGPKLSNKPPRNSD